MRLINPDALDSVVHRLNTEGAQITRSEYKRIDLVISEFPAVDAEPARHGRWEFSPFDGNWTCSKCGNKPYHYAMKNMNYCPNCGAKTDERKEE